MSSNDKLTNFYNFLQDFVETLDLPEEKKKSVSNVLEKRVGTEEARAKLVHVTLPLIIKIMPQINDAFIQLSEAFKEEGKPLDTTELYNSLEELSVSCHTIQKVVKEIIENKEIYDPMFDKLGRYALYFALPYISKDRKRRTIGGNGYFSFLQ